MKKNIEFGFQSPEESPGFLLWQLSMMWQRNINRALAEFDLTHTQFVVIAVLAWLGKQSEVVTQVEIARRSNIDKMLVSKVLRSLQSKGFIERSEHKTDTRAKQVVLSKMGYSILQKAIVKVEAVDSKLFSALGDKQATFNKNINSLLEKTL